MLFEIINPSDAYTIEAPDMEIAACACIVLGRGHYAFEEIGGDAEVPMFLFGGHDAWFKQQFGGTLDETLDRVMKERREDLAACLDSVLIGSGADRDTYHRGLALIDDPAKRAEWRAQWHDERRSSLNDIGGNAYRIAEQLREVLASA